jgi:hypothetical protein
MGEQDPTCWLARFSDAPCEGALVRCHLLDQQVLAKTYPEGAVWLPDAPGAISARALRRLHVVYDDTAREMTLHELRLHPALWEAGCGGITGIGGHHGAFDHYKLPVPRSAVSQRTLTFVHELGLSARWGRDRRFSENGAHAR